MAKRKRKKGKKTPGVFVDEVSSGARPIEGVGTAVAAFIGLAPMKPLRLAVTAVVLVTAVRAAQRAM